MRVRRDKRARMLAEGIEPYPIGYPRTATLADIRAKYADLPTDTATDDVVSVTGRVIFIRNTGKLCFATLREGDGTELQAMLSLDRVGPEALERWKRLVDLGDHVGVTGGGTSRSRRRCCNCCTAGRPPGHSSPTTMPWTSTCTCESRPSCISSARWWAESSGSSRSTGISAMRASTPPTRRSSRCWRRT